MPGGCMCDSHSMIMTWRAASRWMRFCAAGAEQGFIPWNGTGWKKKSRPHPSCSSSSIRYSSGTSSETGLLTVTWISNGSLSAGASSGCSLHLSGWRLPSQYFKPDVSSGFDLSGLPLPWPCRAESC